MENLLKEHNKYMDRTLGLINMVNNMSNESDSSFLKEISTFFSSKIQGLVNLFSSNVNERLKFKSNDKLNAFVVELKESIKKTSVFSKVQYNEIKNLKVPTVIGLNTDLMTATKTISPLLDIIRNNSLEHLDNLDVLTSKIVTDQDFRLKTRSDPDYFKIEDDVRSLDKGLNKIFNTKNLNDMDSFGNLFNNNNSVKTVAEALVGIGSGITLDNIKDLEERISSITEKINVLIDQLKDKEFELSKVVLNDYSKTIEACSQYVTSCISVIQAYNQLVVVTKTIINMVYDKFENKRQES